MTPLGSTVMRSLRPSPLKSTTRLAVVGSTAGRARGSRRRLPLAGAAALVTGMADTKAEMQSKVPSARARQSAVVPLVPSPNKRSARSSSLRSATIGVPDGSGDPSAEVRIACRQLTAGVRAQTPTWPSAATPMSSGAPSWSRSPETGVVVPGSAAGAEAHRNAFAARHEVTVLPSKKTRSLLPSASTSRASGTAPGATASGSVLQLQAPPPVARQRAASDGVSSAASARPSPSKSATKRCAPGNTVAGDATQLQSPALARHTDSSLSVKSTTSLR